MRLPHSHKGENGKVAIVGGSRFQHGAPIFSALAAQAGGCDLLYVRLPARHEGVAKNASLNFQVHPFSGDEFSRDDLSPTLELLATVDAAVIGPGLARTPETLSALRALVESATCPLVLDASALQPWTLAATAGKGCIVTPHLGELERMGVDPDAIAEHASRTQTTILLKGPVDRVASPDGTIREIAGGDAGLTVGGTGDALAGLTASLLSQHATAAEACAKASAAIKRAGAELARDNASYTTRDVIARLPRILKEID